MKCKMKNDRTLMRLCCVTSHSTIFQLYRGVLLVEKIGIPEEIYRPAISYWQTLSHNVVSSTPCMNIGSWKTNYHTITTTRVSKDKRKNYYLQNTSQKTVN